MKNSPKFGLKKYQHFSDLPLYVTIFTYSNRFRRLKSKISCFDLIKQSASTPFISLAQVAQQKNMYSHNSHQTTNHAKYSNDMISSSAKQESKAKKTQEHLINSLKENQAKLDLIRRIRSNFSHDLLQAKKTKANNNVSKQVQVQNEIINKIKTEFAEIFPKKY